MIETGKRRPQPDAVVRLADVRKVSPIDPEYAEKRANDLAILVDGAREGAVEHWHAWRTPS